MLRQLPQALFDMLGKLQPILRVQSLEFFLADRGFGLCSSLRILSFLAALDRPFESLVKVHQLIRSSVKGRHSTFVARAQLGQQAKAQ